MKTLVELNLFPTKAKIVFTGRLEGNASPFAQSVEALLDKPLYYAKQVHSSNVLEVNEPSDGALFIKVGEGDAIVGNPQGSYFGVFGADCPPICLASKEGVCACVHGGWRPLKEKILEKTASKMKDLGATDIFAARGPGICPKCYEFGKELEDFVKSYGESVTGVARSGRTSLDLAQVIRLELERLGVKLVAESAFCTMCSGLYFSSRATSATERQLGAITLIG